MNLLSTLTNWIWKLGPKKKLFSSFENADFYMRRIFKGHHFPHSHTKSCIYICMYQLRETCIWKVCKTSAPTSDVPTEFYTPITSNNPLLVKAQLKLRLRQSRRRPLNQASGAWQFQCIKTKVSWRPSKMHPTKLWICLFELFISG